MEDTNTTSTLHKFQPWELVIWFSLYVIVAGAAVIGNFLVIYIVVTSKRMATSSINLLLINIALADALTGMLAIPFRFQAALLQKWLLPSFMCSLVPYVESVTLSVSVFTLTIAALDRVRMILVYSEQGSAMSKRACTLAAGSTWLLSLAISAPVGLFHKTQTIYQILERPAASVSSEVEKTLNVYEQILPNSTTGYKLSESANNLSFNGTNITFLNGLTVADSKSMNIDQESSLFQNLSRLCCLPVYHDHYLWHWYNIYLAVVQYFLPMLVITVCYAVVSYKITITGPVSDTMDPRHFNRNKRRVVKMLLIVVSVFTFCWLPYETYLVLSEIKPAINSYHYINIIFFSCHWLAMSNSCLNPIIYGIYNEKFQREYRIIIMRLLRRDVSTIVRQDSCRKGGPKTKHLRALIQKQKNQMGDEGIQFPFVPFDKNGFVVQTYIAGELGLDEDEESCH